MKKSKQWKKIQKSIKKGINRVYFIPDKEVLLKLINSGYHYSLVIDCVTTPVTNYISIRKSLI